MEMKTPIRGSLIKTSDNVLAIFDEIISYGDDKNFEGNPPTFYSPLANNIDDNITEGVFRFARPWKYASPKECQVFERLCKRKNKTVKRIPVYIL